MGQLSRPLVPDGPVGRFYDRLHDLHRAAGQPSVRELQRRTRAPRRPHGINPTTIHDVFSAPRLSRWEVVGPIVEQLGGDVAEFGDMWRAARRAAMDDERPAPERAPRQLPPDVHGFTGRGGQLAALDGLLAERARRPAVVITTVSGSAGVGKTALAVHWAHRHVAAFPDGVLYVDLRGYDPQEPLAATDALGFFLRALGVAGADLPRELAERAGTYRTLLAGRQMLVLLDNARTAEQVRPLLPASPSGFVLVTSRDRLAGLTVRDGARRVVVAPMPAGDAFALLNHLVGPAAADDPAAVAALAERAAYLPLALRIVAERVNTSGAPLRALAGDLADERRRLALLDAGGDERTAVRVVFSWSYRSLKAPVARAFRLLGLHPGHDVAVGAVAALVGVTGAVAAELVAGLVRAHLIEPGAGGWYRIHDLLRAYTMELVDRHESASDRRAARGRLFDHYRAAALAAVDVLFPHERHLRPDVPVPPEMVPADAAAARAWLDRERATLLAVVGQAAEHGFAEHVTHLATILWRALYTGAHYAEALTVQEHALAMARARGDRTAEAAALHNQGSVVFWWERYAEAKTLFERALEIRRDIGDLVGQAGTLNNLGLVCDRLGLRADALEYARHALDLRRAVGDRSGEARTLDNLGIAYERSGRYPEAVEHHEEALLIRREIGDRTGEGDTLGNLGFVYARIGRYAEALDRHREALAIARETGHRIGEASALDNLGVVHARAGRHEEALEHHRRSLELFREIGNRDGEVATLDNIGAVLAALGRHGEALASVRESAGLAHDIGDSRREASARNGIGVALRLSGDPVAASAEHATALALATGAGDRYEQARALAGVAAALGCTAEAGEPAARAVAMFRELGVPDPVSNAVTSGNTPAAGSRTTPPADPGTLTAAGC